MVELEQPGIVDPEVMGDLVVQRLHDRVFEVGRERVRATHSWDRIGRRLEEVYDEVRAT